MVLLLHAVLTTDAVVSPPAGLRGWPLREVCAAGLSAWATLCEEETVALGRGDLLAQHTLLEQALGVCLPVRFPTWLANEDAVRELLARRRSELLAALARVRGRVELAVTITWAMDARASTPPVTATSPGKQYLEERRRHYVESDQRRSEAQRLAKLIESEPRVVEARHTVCSGPEIGLSSALLVAEADALAVAKRLRGLREGVRILVNGPWPPYSFVSLEA